MIPNAAQAYRRMQVTTASPPQLVVQLYEGAICFLERAIPALEAGDVEQAHLSLTRAQDIITQLRASLNRDAGPLALQLDGLYDYFWRQLVAANARKDPAIARQILGYLQQLVTAWRAIAAPPWGARAGSGTALVVDASSGGGRR